MMKKKLPIRYYETNSPLNSLNPLVKLVWLVFLSFLILWFNNYRLEIALLLCSLILFRISKVSLLKLQGSRFVITTAIVIGLIQLVFNQAGETLLEVGIFNITQAGFENALLISTRFVTLIILGYLFVITTEPNEFVYSLMQIGLPYRYGFSLITALRLIPIFTDEATNIFNAQITRGVVYRFFPPGRLFGNVFRFMKVLLISTIKKVDALVISMEGRSFGAKPSRSYVRRSAYSAGDKTLLVLAVLLTIIFIYWGRNIVL